MESRLIKTLAVLAVLLGTTTVASAFSMSSTNYKVDDGALNSFGGTGSSTNYMLTDSGGEAFIGPGSSTNYKFNAGYVASLDHSISLSLNSLTVTIPAVTAGTSKNVTSTVSVGTDAAGYLLAVRQDGDLTKVGASTTIPAISATIASPALWTEGTTKGLGFTLTSGTSLEGKWGTNPNYDYAAFPTDTDTTIHDKPGYLNAQTLDPTVIQYRLDVSSTQLPGSYQNHVTYSATVKL